MGERMKIAISGGGPWGFRLQGGEEEPLRIAKIRRRSKANIADLQEGDILVGVNGISCQGLTHHDAMETIDDSGDRLVLEIVRLPGSNPIQSGTSGVINGNMQPSRFGQTTSTTRSVIKQFGPGGQVKETRNEQMTTQPYGGPQNTQVRREEMVYGGGNSVLQPVGNVHQRPPTKFGGGPGLNVVDYKSSYQSPTGPAIVDSHMDDSGAMSLTIGMGGGEKENISPPRHIGQYPQPWQPMQFDQPNLREDLPMSPDHGSSMPAVWSPQNTPKNYSTPCSEIDSGYGPAEQGEIALPKVMPATPGMKPLALSKILQESFDETPPESPARLKKMILDPTADCSSSTKKMYADSAFFDDPNANYPTVEEQIKLARTVANVLTSEAAKQNSRGAKMFTKRKERADKYTHEQPEEGEEGFPKVHEPHRHSKPFLYKCIDPDAPVRAPTWKPAPPPLLPPRPKSAPMDSTPTPLGPKNVITPAQLEQIKLKAPKAEHNAVAPEKCFNLAAALHASKGRGGQIFAKRRAKSESWVVDESNVKSPPPVEKKPHPLANLKPVKPGSKSAAPLASSVTPWEAAMKDPIGNVEKAFEHLPTNKRHTIGSDVFDNLGKNQGWGDTPKSSLEAEKRDNPNFKDFNRRARGWRTGGQPENDKWSTSSVASSDSDSRSSSVIRSISFQQDDQPPKSTGAFVPKKMTPSSYSRFSDRGASRQPAFVAGGDSGATDL